MEENQDNHCISKMAKCFNVSRSGFYSFLNCELSERAQQNDFLCVEIERNQEKTKYSLGQKPMTALLKSEYNIPLGHNRIGRIMRENGLLTKRKKRKWKPKEEKDLNNRHRNILDRDFKPGTLNKVWVTDTSYIETTKGWYYLCPVMDLGNREIIGWDFSDSPDTEAASRALDFSLMERNFPRNILFHSDRGSQFCADVFQKKLKVNNFMISLSRRGNCWDNACIESFFKVLKHDWLYKYPVMNPEKTRALIFEYIEVIYNRFRPHGSLNMMSPIEYKKICA